METFYINYVGCGSDVKDWFQLELIENTVYNITLLFSHSQGDVDAFLFQDSSQENIARGFSSTDNEFITLQAPSTGTYYLSVEIFGRQAFSQTYDLIIDFPECQSDEDCAPNEICINNSCAGTNCGNGIREANELCDDGNANDYDGCTTECEITSDEEPNNNYETAISTANLSQIFYGKLDPNTDQDWYRLELSAGGYSFETFDTSNGLDSVDTLIYLCRNPDPNICNLDNSNVPSDNDSGQNQYSRLPIALPEGVYYLIVQSFNFDTTGFYGLTISQ